MIDVQHEHLLTLPEASRLIPGRPSTATLWRWRTKGIGGRVLESIAVGGRIYTSREAVGRFARSASLAEQPTSRTSRQRERDIATAERQLAEAGI